MQRASAIILGTVVVVALAIVGFLLAYGGRLGTPEPSVAATRQATPAANASVAADLVERRWTVAFIGLDSNEARESRGEPVNADALMVVSVSADGSRVALVSLPRDTVDVPLPDGSTYDGKINALYRERGMEPLVGALGALYDVPVDGYVALDMDDFTRVVDAVGTIEVSPDEPLTDPIVDLDLAAGAQEIDAATANGYVRTRVDQDYGRMSRQQEVLVALVRELVDPEAEVDLPTLVGSLESLDTNLPLEELPSLVEVARRAADAEVERLLIEPPLIVFEGDRNDGRGYVLEPDVEAIRAEVRDLIGED